jgi:hypothetical protein
MIVDAWVQILFGACVVSLSKKLITLIALSTDLVQEIDSSLYIWQIK